MKGKLLELIYNYAVNSKLPDEKFIETIVMIVTDKRNLSEFIKVIKFIRIPDDNDIDIAIYNSFELSITIKLNSCFKELFKNLEKYSFLFTDFEQRLYVNKKMTEWILHELEHVYQHKSLVYNTSDSIEMRIISACSETQKNIMDLKFIEYINESMDNKKKFIGSLNKFKEVYEQYYRFSPKERLADLYSCEIIKEELDLIKKQIESLYLHQEMEINSRKIRNYKESFRVVSFPTQIYLNSLNQGSILKDIDYKKLSLEERLKLGLFITPYEYETFNNNSKRLML